MSLRCCMCRAWSWILLVVARSRRQMMVVCDFSSDVRSSDAAIIGFFFFQAEDGIRDLTVTGVQTCALPISVERPVAQLPGAGHCGPGPEDLVPATGPGRLAAFCTAGGGDAVDGGLRAGRHRVRDAVNAGAIRQFSRARHARALLISHGVGAFDVRALR